MKLPKNLLKAQKRVSFKIGLACDFPGGPVVKNPPCNAWGTGFIPDGKTKIPPATGQLRLHAANYGAHTPKLENPCTTRKDPA